MGYDNRLFASFPLPEGDDPAIIIIDTLTDTFTDLDYPQHGIDALSLDAVHHKLYCSVYTEQWEPLVEDTLLMPSPVVLEIDLENQYTSREITLDMEYIRFLDVVPINVPDFNARLFCRLKEGSDMFYADVD
jgi:hypothetical protein